MKLADLKKHAEKFGPECVLDTAIDLGYAKSALVELQEFLERTELARIRQSRPRYQPSRLRTTIEERVDAAIARRRKEVPQ